MLCQEHAFQSKCREGDQQLCTSAFCFLGSVFEFVSRSPHVTFSEVSQGQIDASALDLVDGFLSGDQFSGQR